MTGVVCPERTEIEVDGRTAVLLKSGRAVWKDEAADEFGAWFAERFKFPQYLVTFSHDPKKSARRRLHGRGIASPSESLVESESHRNVTHEVFASWVRGWIREVGRAARQPVYAVGGTESHKSGDSHAHLALSIGDEPRFGDVRMMHSKWFQKFGYIDASPVKSVEDVVRYATKYVFKDIATGQWLMSGSLYKRMKLGKVALL